MYTVSMREEIKISPPNLSEGGSLCLPINTKMGKLMKSSAILGKKVFSKKFRGQYNYQIDSYGHGYDIYLLPDFFRIPQAILSWCQ